MIKALEEEVINKIAAGEVIEKPACIVRELLDNSLDAKAKNITIKISFNPFYIKIEDDGDGIAQEQVTLAFKRHTTSKITSLNDIYDLKTRGFRGEALAAIASVSEVKVVTKTKLAEVATELTLRGGEILNQKEVAGNQGTSITIKNLFYNAPVRKKFITTINNQGQIQIKAQEKKNIKEEIIHHILASANVSFNYYFTSEKKIEEMQVPASLSLKDKIDLFFTNKNSPSKIAHHLIPLNQEYNGFQIKGYLTDLTIREKNSRQQFLIMHNRVVKDYRFTKALQNAYFSRLPGGTYPMAFVQIIPPQKTVDINVHPQKKEVRFKNNQDFFQAIYYSVKASLDELIVKKQREQLAKSATAFYNPPIDSYEEPTLTFNQEKSSLLENPLTKNFSPSRENEKIPQAEKEVKNSQEHYPQIKNSPFLLNENFTVLGQVALCYIVFVIGDDLYLTDQHAAHERINFDKINDSLQHSKLTSQNLLIPLILERDALEKEIILEKKKLLAKYSLELEDFGEKNLRLLSYPSFIKEEKLPEVVSDVLEAIVEKGNITLEDLSQKIVARMACRMSVMKGDALTKEEMKAIIQEVYEKDYIHTCPHGRPFVKKISTQELAGFFERNKHIL